MITSGGVPVLLARGLLEVYRIGSSGELPFRFSCQFLVR